MNYELIFSSLSFPRIIDGKGNLYILRQEDEAIVFVDGPSKNKEARYVATYMNEVISWVATNDKMFFLFEGKKNYVVDFCDDPILVGSRNSAYDSVFHINKDGKNFFIRNTPKGASCYLVSDQIMQFFLEMPVRCFDGWVEDDFLFLVGMRPRIRSEKETSYELQRGVGLLVRINLTSKDVQYFYTDNIKGNLKIPNTAAIKISDATKNENFIVESWLGCFEYKSVNILIGAVADVRPAEDDLYVYEEPHWRDFDGVSLFWLEGHDELHLKSLLIDFSPLCVVNANGMEIIYVIKKNEKSIISNVNCMCSSNNYQFPVLVEIHGLDVSALIINLNIMHYASIGFFGVIDVVIDRNPQSFVIYSENGLKWSSFQQLFN
jgi:hypothetical protein